MVKSFQEYLEIRKQGLDQVFVRLITDVLGEIPMIQATPFLATLAAGKKIRGCLTCLVTECLGGTFESALTRALAVELIQTATLIHDDFVDQDKTRRNLPASWTLEGARRAVLIGDVLFATAIKMMSDLGVEDGKTVSQAIAQVSCGALYELLEPMRLERYLESPQRNGRLYEKIIYLKTGILFGAACRLGAIAAEAGSDLRDSVFRYGARIGEAYQIADDLKDSKLLLRQGSITPEQVLLAAPLLFFFLDGAGPFISSILQDGRRPKQEEIRRFLEPLGALMEAEIERRLKSACSEIEGRFPHNSLGGLARKAPWELIQLFNES
jgi:Polyprenyl synthetase